MQEEVEKENIGIFDSGIGGVTVLREIIKILPNENYIYYSDSKNNPYGDKKKEEIIERCEEIFRFLLEINCKAIVIACNTASAKSVQYLRQMYKNIPFIAIEPAYKMVYDYAYNEPTLVMATKGTIESEKFNLLYNKYNNHKTILLPCVGLADVIEEGNKNKIKEYLNQLLEKYKGKSRVYVRIKRGLRRFPGPLFSFKSSIGSRRCIDPGAVSSTAQRSFHFYSVIQIFEGAYLNLI